MYGLMLFEYLSSISTSSKIAVYCGLLLVVLLVVDVIKRVIYWLGRQSKGPARRFRRFMRRLLGADVHRPAPEHLKQVPFAQISTCTDGKGDLVAVVKVNGYPVAQFRPSDAPGSRLARPFVKEMAAPGSLPLRPANVKETRYAVVFGDSERTMGSGFALSLGKGRQFIVTADHVYTASTVMRGAHQDEWISIKTLPGITFSDVRFIEVHADTLSRMAVRTRPPPANLHRGSGDIFLNREKGFRAPCVFEDVVFDDTHDDFSFTHVSCTQPGDSGSPILVGKGSIPVAVHVGANETKGKNIAVALYPLIRLLYRADTDKDPEPETIKESDDRYEAMFKYLPPDDFYDVTSRRKGAKAQYRLRGVKEVDRGYGVTDKGVYTVFDSDHVLWSETPDDADLPVFELPHYLLRERSTAPPKSEAPVEITPVDAPPVMDDSIPVPAAKARVVTDGAVVQSSSSDFRRRSRAPLSRTVYTMEGAMPSLSASAQLSPHPSLTRQVAQSRPILDSRRLEELTRRLEEVERRNEVACQPRSSPSSQNSQDTNSLLPQESRLLELLSSRLAAQLQRAPSMPAPQAEKSTSGPGAHPRRSEPPPEKRSRNSRRRRSKASKGVVVQDGPSSSTHPPTKTQ